MSNEPARAMDELFDGDEVREVLREAFYKPSPAAVPKPVQNWEIGSTTASPASRTSWRPRRSISPFTCG